MEQDSEHRESLEKVRLPMTLNLSQCLLELGECEQVVQLNDELLKTHKGGETHARTLGMAPKAGGGNIKAAFNVETGARHTCINACFFLLRACGFFFFESEPLYLRLQQ